MAVDVDSTALQKLLDLQAEDTAIKRLTEQKASLPESRRLEEVKDHLAELDSDLEIARKQQDEANREVSRLEGEVELIDQKTQREEARMYGGQVSNPKELSALQAEVASLKKRKSGVEDQELEAMEVRDQAVATLERLTSEHETATTETSELTSKVAELTKDIDGQLAQHTSARDQLAPQIPESVLGLYEKIRDQKGGIGAAALEGGTGQGCHTKLPAKEAERVRGEGGLQRCDNCRRILVVV